MTCYGGGSFIVAGGAAFLYWKLHALINTIVTDIGIALAVTVSVIIVSLLITAAAALIRALQRRRARSGACTTCRFQCQRAQVSGDAAPVPSSRRAIPVIVIPQPGASRERTRASR